MTTPELLHTFLQLHLASDNSAVVHLPYILQNLSAEALENSVHLSKWNARISSLIHSRESGARWAGLCLARHTCVLSRAFIPQSSQGWVTIVLPMLSRNETLPVWKASIRLLLYVFLNATAFPEFQRQVTTPNVPKLTQALVQLCQKQSDHELHILCTDGITFLITVYPSLHRPLHPSLSAFINACLDGVASTSRTVPADLLESMVRMVSVLHLSGGKTGAAGLWRKTFDERITKCYSLFKELRSTYYVDGDVNMDTRDPAVVVPLLLEQLRCSAETLCALLRTVAPRPVPIPIAAIVELIVTMMKSNGETKGSAQYYDSTRRALETVAIPHIVYLSCKIATCLASCAKRHIAPYATRLYAIIAFQLEQSNPSSIRLPLTKLTVTLLRNCYAPSDGLLAGRILKALLPLVGSLLAPKDAQLASVSSDFVRNVGMNGAEGKAPKNKRNQEPDDILGTGKTSIRISKERKELILVSLDAISLLLRTPGLPPYLLSLTSRLLLALSLRLPTTPLASTPSSAASHCEIHSRVQQLCVESAAFLESGRGVLSRTLPIIARNAQSSISTFGLGGDYNELLLDLMIHPRLPPLLREIPPMDVLSLSYSEEGVEERQTREALGVGLQPRMDSHISNSNSVVHDTIVLESRGTTVPTSSAAIAASDGPALSSERHATTSNSIPQPATASSPYIQPQPPVTEPLAGPSGSQELPIIASSADKSNATPSATKQTPTSASWLPVSQLDGPKLTPPSTFASAPASSGIASTSNNRMVVDDEDDDDIEVPPINMESDTDEE